MAENDQQNVESESGDLHDSEPAANTGNDELASADGRSWTTVAIVAVAVFICIATLFIFFLLRNRSSEPGEIADETRAAAEASDEIWAAIQERGTIVVGTAADYPPFEFYNRDFELDGLDIALMKEIGRRLGLEVELRDMAFDGLGNALQVEQIDAAISAITITDQRRQFVDFSDTYSCSMASKAPLSW